VLTAKGDLLTASDGFTPTPLPVGADDYVLTADSAETTGLKWVALAPVVTGVQTLTSPDGSIQIGGTATDVTVQATSTGDTIVAIPDATSVTPNALAGLVRVFTWAMGANSVCNAFINGEDTQIVRLRVKAVGADRILTLSGFLGSTDFSTAAVPIPSGKKWTGTFQFDAETGWQIVGKVLQA